MFDKNGSLKLIDFGSSLIWNKNILDSELKLTLDKIKY